MPYHDETSIRESIKEQNARPSSEKAPNRKGGVIGREHPGDDFFTHRGHYTTTQKEAIAKIAKSGGVIAITPANERIKKIGHTVCGIRDKMAGASSSSKTGRFIPKHTGLDARLDAPIVTTGYHMVNRGQKRKGHSLRSMLV